MQMLSASATSGWLVGDPSPGRAAIDACVDPASAGREVDLSRHVRVKDDGADPRARLSFPAQRPRARSLRSRRCCRASLGRCHSCRHRNWPADGRPWWGSAAMVTNRPGSGIREPAPSLGSPGLAPVRAHRRSRGRPPCRHAASQRGPQGPAARSRNRRSAGRSSGWCRHRCDRSPAGRRTSHRPAADRPWRRPSRCSDRAVSPWTLVSQCAPPSVVFSNPTASSAM